MSIADRMAVMNEGVLEQVGLVQEVYDRPLTKFVASFIGTNNLIYKNSDGHKRNELWEIAGKACKDSSMNNADCRGRITESVYRGNIIEYKLLTGSYVLKVQANTRERFTQGEEVFFNINNAVVIGRS
jgi:ABC-type Fe3+/spermidine/putrescine transport system ATPase subunit